VPTKEKAKTSGRKIKYVGSSHVRRLDKGEDFGGRLAKPLEKKVEWNFANNHIVDAGEAGLSDAAVELLLEQQADMFDSGQYDEDDPEQPTDENTIQTLPEFVDVSNEDVIQPSLAQQIYLGVRPMKAKDALRQSEEGTGQTISRAVSATAGAQPSSVGGGGTTTGANVTTVGGSTDGAGGDVGGPSAS
jgi:hypothetical protein